MEIHSPHFIFDYQCQTIFLEVRFILTVMLRIRRNNGWEGWRHAVRKCLLFLSTAIRRGASEVDGDSAFGTVARARHHYFWSCSPPLRRVQPDIVQLVKVRNHNQGLITLPVSNELMKAASRLMAWSIQSSTGKPETISLTASRQLSVCRRKMFFRKSLP